ncbi:hypothetical protein GCM10023107_16210 [Actinoplanes octamycinicus]
MVVGDRLVLAVVAQQLHARAVADHVGGGTGGGGSHFRRIRCGSAEREGKVGERVPEGVSHDTHVHIFRVK